ncbi:MAG: glycosyltransferase family 4 protein [Deltaproteobacteria bacterium]|nr:glycosyltransferase family 4 protein [Deltaproteobacteria bacterium]
MRVALARSRYSPHGGAERYLDALANRLRETGAHVRILSSSWEGAEQSGSSWVRIDVPNRPAPLRLFLFARAVGQWARAHPDWLLFSWERLPGAEVVRAGDGCHAEWMRRKRSLRPHTAVLDQIRPLNRAYLLLERRMFTSEKLLAVIANSSRGKEEILRHFGIAGEKVFVVHNGVDLSRFPAEKREEARANLRGRFDISGDETVFLFVGSGFARKGVGALTDAAIALARTGKRFRILVVGKGDPRPYMNRAAASGAGSALRFLGPVSGAEEFYLGSDAFVFPTVYEPFSNACLEAMAAGLPVITTGTNGVTEIFRDGDAGFVLADPFDVPALAGRMEELLDPALRMRMGTAAREAAERVPLEKKVGEILGVLSRAWEKKTGKPSGQAALPG